MWNGGEWPGMAIGNGRVYGSLTCSASRGDAENAGLENTRLGLNGPVRKTGKCRNEKMTDGPIRRA